MLSAPLAMLRLSCGMASGVPCACGTMDITSLTPSLSSQAIKSVFAFVLKARHPRGTPTLTAIRSILRPQEKGETKAHEAGRRCIMAPWRALPRRTNVQYTREGRENHGNRDQQGSEGPCCEGDESR